ncbi:MAG TPA: heme exporter protein CcmB [Longimicrobiales bacterium]|nr:heme exporter protein CcmB [Longimicrobiales bacterium]
MTLLRQWGAVVRKDLLLELRSRQRLATMGGFAVLVAVLFNYALDQTLVDPQDVAAGLIWMTLIFAGVMGVGRTFELEAQDAAFQGVLLSPIPRDTLYLAKVTSNFILVLVVVGLVLGVFGLFFQLDYGDHPLTLIAILTLGALGFVALATLFGAVSSGTTLGETLLPILVFPLLVPMVVFGTSATGRLLQGRPVAEVGGQLRMLAAFALVAVVAGAGLFRYVVED